MQTQTEKTLNQAVNLFKSITEEVSRSFIEGGKNNELVATYLGLIQHYKPSHFGYLTSKNEPFLGDCTRLPNSSFIVSSGPQTEEQLMTLLYDTVLDYQKIRVLKLVSAYFNEQDQKHLSSIEEIIVDIKNKHRVMEAIQNLKADASSMKNKDVALQKISKMIGDQLLVRPSARHIVALIDQVSCDSEKKDAYDYCLTERIIENDDIFIKIKNLLHGSVSTEIQEEVNPKELAEHSQNYSLVTVCKPSGPVVRSKLEIKDKWTGETKTLNVTIFWVEDNNIINLETKDSEKEEILENLWQCFEISQKENVVVHCKAGVGRTGYFTLMMQTFENLKAILAKNDVNYGKDKINEIIKNMRQARPGLISYLGQMQGAIDHVLMLYAHALKKDYIKDSGMEEQSTLRFPALNLVESAEPIVDTALVSVDVFSKVPFEQRSHLVYEFNDAFSEFNQQMKGFIQNQLLNDKGTENEIFGELRNLFDNIYQELLKCTLHTNSKDLKDLKKVIAQSNENFEKILPFENNKNIIKLDDSELAFLVKHPRRLNKQLNIAIAHTIGYMTGKHIEKSLLELLSWFMDSYISSQEKIRSAYVEKYQKFLALLVQHQCFYTLDYLLSKDPDIEKTTAWFAEQALDPCRESKERKYRALDQVNEAQPIHNVADDGEDQGELNSLSDELFDSYLEAGGCSPDKIAQFRSLAQELNQPVAEVFEKILMSESENSDLYEIVIRKKLEALFEYFPYHSDTIFEVLNKENAEEMSQPSKKKVSINMLTPLEREDLQFLSDTLTWTPERVLESIQTTNGLYSLAQSYQLLSLLPYFSTDDAVSAQNDPPKNTQDILLSLEPEARMQLNALADLTGSSFVEGVFRAISDKEDSINAFLYDMVQANSQEFFLLLQYFPQYAQKESAQLQKKIELKPQLQSAEITYSLSVNEQISLLAQETDVSRNQVLAALENKDESMEQYCLAFGFDLLLKTFFPEEKQEAKKSIAVAEQAQSVEDPELSRQIKELAEAICQSVDDVKKDLDLHNEELYEIASGLELTKILERFFPEKNLLNGTDYYSYDLIEFEVTEVEKLQWMKASNFERAFLRLAKIAGMSVEEVANKISGGDGLRGLVGIFQRLDHDLSSLARENPYEFRSWFQKQLSSSLQLQYGTDVEVISKTIKNCGDCVLKAGGLRLQSLPLLVSSGIERWIWLCSDVKSANAANDIFDGLRVLVENDCIMRMHTFSYFFNSNLFKMASFNRSTITKYFQTMGALAHTKFLSVKDKISAKSIEQLLDKFSGDPSFTEIEDSEYFQAVLEIESIFLGLWYLSKKDKIYGCISARSIDKLLAIFQPVKFGEQLENIFYAIEYLTVKKNIEGEVGSNIKFFNDTSNSICYLSQTISIREQLAPPLMRHFIREEILNADRTSPSRKKLLNQTFTNYCYPHMDLYYVSIRKKDFSDEKLKQIFGSFCSHIAKKIANKELPINLFFEILHKFSQADNVAQGQTAQFAKSMLCHAFPYAKNSMLFFSMPLNNDVKRLVFQSLIDLADKEDTTPSKSVSAPLS
jgi:hypothetical protein